VSRACTSRYLMYRGVRIVTVEWRPLAGDVPAQLLPYPLTAQRYIIQMHSRSNWAGGMPLEKSLRCRVTGSDARMQRQQ
jgi:hypothetical protein